MMRLQPPPAPLWPTVWQNRRPVAAGAAGFAAASLGAAFVAVPAFKLCAALFLVLYLLAGGQ